MRRTLLWGPPVLYMFLIYRFSSESNPMPVVTEHIWDKLLHTSEYAGLAALLGRAVIGEGFSYGTACLLAVLLTSAYGATDEYHQLFVPARTADLRDWIADTTGGAIGAVCYTGARLWSYMVSASRAHGAPIVTSIDTRRAARPPD
jgi:VanZ family protein